jgi:hypothetical protein
MVAPTMVLLHKKWLTMHDDEHGLLDIVLIISDDHHLRVLIISGDDA